MLRQQVMSLTSNGFGTRAARMAVVDKRWDRSHRRWAAFVSGIAAYGATIPMAHDTAGGATGRQMRR